MRRGETVASAEQVYHPALLKLGSEFEIARTRRSFLFNGVFEHIVGKLAGKLASPHIDDQKIPRNNTQCSIAGLVDAQNISNHVRDAP